MGLIEYNGNMNKETMIQEDRKLSQMQRWFISDPHLGHTNILKYCSRDFPNIREHDKVLMDNLNSCAKENDELHIIGDFCFGDPGRYLDQIICKNIFFVVGSHDKQIWNYRSRFRVFEKERYRTVIDGTHVIMVHECPLVWPLSHHGSICIFGHSHGRLGNSRGNVFEDEYQKAISLILSRAKSIDVGVDTFDDTHNRYFPYSWDEIITRMNKKQGFLVNRERD